MANTRDVMGEQACLDALISKTITSFEDDDIIMVGAYGLYMQGRLTEVILPNCKDVNMHGISLCSNLSHVELLGGGELSAYSFDNSPNITSIIIRGDKATTQDSRSGLSATKIGIREGAVYVESDMVDTYRKSSDWQNYPIRPISEYPTTDFSTILDSWDEIIAACGDGSYEGKYLIGDTKSIDIGDKRYYMQLVGKDVDVLASDGVTKVATSWMIYRRMYYGTKRMKTAVGGWEQSEMRSWLSGTVLPLLPSNVASAIKEVRKYSSGIASGDSTYTMDGRVTADKLWIPSARELNISSNYESQGPAYATSIYVSGWNTTAAQNSRIKYSYNSDEARPWWTRSVSSATEYLHITKNGSCYSISANTNNNVVFGFCI